MADTIGTANISPIRGMKDDEWKRFCELVENGKSNMAISSDMNLSEKAVSEKAAQLRKILRRESRSFAHNGSSYTPIEDETIIRLRDQGYSNAEIGKAVGRSGSGISSRIILLRKKFPNDPRLAIEQLPSKGEHKRVRAAHEIFDQWKRATHLQSTAAKFSPAMYDQTPKPHMAGRPLDVTDGCRYACNEANVLAGEEHLFCGTKRVPGKSYCADHLHICEPMMRRAA